MSKVVVFGGTGAVGRELVDELVNAPDVERVHLILRRSSSIGDGLEKVTKHVYAEWKGLDELSLEVDTAFVCLGTTMAVAGSREAFYAVDYELVLRFSKWSRAQGASELHVISSMGAKLEASSFYLQTKAKMELALKELGFERLFFYRPSLFYPVRRRGEAIRIKEWVTFILLHGLGGLLPMMDGIRPVRPKDVARSMLEHSRTSSSISQASHVVDSATINSFGYESGPFYTAEFRIQWVAISLGVLGLAVASLFYSLGAPGSFPRGLFLPVMVVSCLMLVAGFVLKWIGNSRFQSSDLESESEERRVRVALRIFTMLALLEIGMIVGGFAGIWLYRGEPFQQGAAVGVCIMGLLLLLLDSNWAMLYRQRRIAFHRSRLA
ncbi:MAG: NAD-dependent epimerase/dehydratase family protein [Coraliomargarita sp.]